MENARTFTEPRRCSMKVRPRIGCGDEALEAPVDTSSQFKCQTCLHDFSAADMNHRKSHRHGRIVMSKNCIECYRRQVRLRTCIFRMNKHGIDASTADGAEMMAMALA